MAQLRREEAARLAAIQQQERAMLELRKEPLKKYLMETVIPPRALLVGVGRSLDVVQNCPACTLFWARSFGLMCVKH